MLLTSRETLMRPQTACFTGHRQLDQNELPALVMRLDQVLNKLYEMGYRRFISGGAMGFDLLAAERVIQLRNRCADVSLILALPCATQTQSWPVAEGQRYEKIIYAADETHVLSSFYFSGCMMVRNRFMVDRSSFVVCYLTNAKGGTASTAAYAMKQEIPLLNTAMPDACTAFCQRITSV
ncbi:MAG: DUF1273 family protein [Clostridia bacterium]|nr:DUF1273 family protein [Clostridia bacterium]